MGFQATGVAVAVALVTALAVTPANAAELVAPATVQDASTTAPVENASGASGDAAAIVAAAADYTPGDAGAAAALAEAASAQDAVALDSSATASLGGASVTVTDTGAAVVSSGEGTPIGISAVGAGAVEFVDGVAVQTGVTPATDIVTRATADGAQLVAVLGDESAGDTVPFALDLPDNATLTPQADGSITVTAPVQVEKPLAGETERIDQQVNAIVGDLDSVEELTPAQIDAIEAIAPAVTETVVEVQQIATIETPWAVDANGTALPTSYTLEGTALTQNIDTTNATYPITADLHWAWWAWTAGTCAANVATFIFAAAKLAYAITKINSLVKKSVTLSNIVAKLGGVKGTLQSIHNAAKGFVQGSIGKYLNSTQRLALSSLVSVGLSTIGDLLGIGSCVSLIRATL